MRKILDYSIILMLASAWCAPAFCADRDTPERDGRFVRVEAGAAIDAGELVAMYTDAEAYPAADTVGYAVIGRAESAAAEGAYVLVKRGIFRWENYGSLTQKDIGTLAYVSNSIGVTTSALTTNTRPAGRIVDVDASGVWVDTYNQDVLLTATVDDLTVNDDGTVTDDLAVGGDLTLTGAASVGGTLAVTGTSTLTGNTTVTGTLTGGGAARLPVLATVAHTVGDLTVTSAHYGKIVVVSTNGAVNATLPAAGAAAGSWVEFLCVGSDDCALTVTAAAADTLITFNNQTADAVTFGTGHRIGANLRVISDGSKWVAVNLGNHTMTVTDD